MPALIIAPHKATMFMQFIALAPWCFFYFLPQKKYLLCHSISAPLWGSSQLSIDKSQDPVFNAPFRRKPLWEISGFNGKLDFSHRAQQKGSSDNAIIQSSVGRIKKVYFVSFFLRISEWKIRGLTETDVMREHFFFNANRKVKRTLSFSGPVNWRICEKTPEQLNSGGKGGPKKDLPSFQFAIFVPIRTSLSRGQNAVNNGLLADKPYTWVIKGLQI